MAIQKHGIWFSVLLGCAFFTIGIISTKAGTLTISSTPDSSNNIVLGDDDDEDVTFTAQSDNDDGTVTLDIYFPHSTNGTPSSTASGDQTIVVTFDDDAIGLSNAGTVTVDHTDPSGTICPSGGTTFNFTVIIPKVEVTVADVSDGLFTVHITPTGTSITGDLIFNFVDSAGNEIQVQDKPSIGDGDTTINLDDFVDSSALVDKTKYTACSAYWKPNDTEIDSDDDDWDDFTTVQVLGNWTVSNYFTPTLGGSWNGSSVSKGFYPSGHYPSGLTNATVYTGFLDSLDPANEGLGLDGSTVIRDHSQTAVSGHPQVTLLNGGGAYIEDPDRNQQTAGGISGYSNLDADAFAALTANSGGLGGGDQVYVKGFGLKTMEDHGGGLSATQVDIWIGTGDQSVKDSANSYGIQTHNLLYCK